MPEKHVVLKPTRQSTLSWLQLSLIVSICGIPPPDDLVLNWLSDQPLVNHSVPFHKCCTYIDSL